MQDFVFNKHNSFSGKHSLLSASKYSWVNKEDSEFIESYHSMEAKILGTELHALAEQLINLGVHLPNEERTLNMHVNDAIDLKMKPEVVLYYSEYAFGTADAIIFDNKNNILRVHDLKTGIIPAKMTQLYVYASYFCLEYDVQPNDIDYEFRIYQNNSIFVDNNVDKNEIVHICDKIVHFDNIIRQLKQVDQ